MTAPPTYWIALTHPLVPWEQIVVRLAEHAAYLDDLIAQGHALAGGPFLETGEPRGAGLTILRAADAADAELLVAGDPLVQAGLWQLDLHQWQVLQVAASVTL